MPRGHMQITHGDRQYRVNEHGDIAVLVQRAGRKFWRRLVEPKGPVVDALRARAKNESKTR